MNLPGQSVSTSSRSRTFERVLVLLFYTGFFLFFSSGRLSGGDPNEQLRAAMLLAATGSLGTDLKPAGEGYNWIQREDGRYFESHDIGAIGVMLPASLVGAVVRKGSVEDWLQRPPAIVKVGASLSYALVAAIGGYFLFLFFGLFHGTRTAFLLSLAFVVTTPFWAFARCAFDVLGGASGVCMLLYASARVLMRERITTGDLVLAFAALAITGSFRYSVFPFFGPALLILLWLRWREVPIKGFVLASIVFAVLVAPTFYYNYVRMGTPLRPATMHMKYLDGMNALSESPVSGLYGMLLSPNWGLVWYAPQFLLLAALPFLRKRLPARHWQFAWVWGIAALLSLAPIACSVNWPGVVGWGSRYVVTVLPIFFAILAIVAAPLWEKRRRLILALGALSFLLNLPPALVNWHEATLANVGDPWPQQIRYPWAPEPRQQIVLWKGFLNGLQGRPLPAPEVWYTDPVLNSIVAFPDLWTFKIMRLSKAGLLAGLVLSIGLILPSVWAARRLLREPALACPEHVTTGAVPQPQ
jgi:hypothetical protein